MQSEIDTAAEGQRLGTDLARTYLAGEPAPADWRAGLRDMDMAYAAQQTVVGEFSRAGKGGVAGYKVGLTSQAMQSLCGITTPICGRILANTILASGAVLRRDRYIRLGIESELAVRVARDITAPLDGPDDEMLDLVESVHAAFEIVDDRNADYARLIASEIVAENSWNVGIVLGEGRAPAEIGPIDRIAGRYFEDGNELGRGSSMDVLGNPLAVVRWLSGFLLEQGSMVRKGDVIMTGSIVATRFPIEGTNCRFELDGLPAVTVRIAAE